MMPYYGMPIGTEYEEVGFSFSRRSHHRPAARTSSASTASSAPIGGWYDAAIVGEPMLARAWGVEQLSPLERA